MNSPSRFSVEALQQQRPFLRTLAMSLLVDEYHAEDAVQDTIVRTLQHGPREESGLGPWMRTVCRNLAMNLRRGNARRRQREALVAPPEATAAPDDGELRAWVVDAVVSLPEPYRDAILRRYYENQEPRDIARQLGVPATTIYSRLQKGLQRLRDELEQRRRREGLDPGAMRAAMCLLAGWPVVTPPPPPTAAPLWWTSGLMVAAVLLAVAWWWPAPPATPPAAGERAVVTTVPTNGVA
ncbi:MAG: sigma-70 family RNA polymerase sigma factor, partial [Planctomycetes bacterium]|nr:sigma-70 family RNA polymerase sigma factor [Planctomycetota bacterium]